MIIDSLTHVTPDGKWFHTDHDASVCRLLTEMDKAHVDKAVVVALAGHIENGFVLKTCKEYPERLIPGASLDPSAYASPREASDAARALLKEWEFAVLKLHPRLNGYDPLDPECLAVLDEIASFEKPIPVWLDTVFRTPRCILRKSPVDTIHELAWRFPGLKFVLLHGCGSNLLQVAEMLGLFENIFLDISLTIFHYGTSSLDQDIDYVLLRRDLRTVVGSDFPEYTPSHYIQRIVSIGKKLGIDKPKTENVLGRNIAEILYGRRV